MNAKSGTLPLDKRIFTRESVAYAITLLCMMAALKTGTFKKSDFDQCLKVDWYAGFLLMLVFVVYALVVIYFDQILEFFRSEPTASIKSSGSISTLTNPLNVAYVSDDDRNVSVDDRQSVESLNKRGVDIFRKSELNVANVIIDGNLSFNHSRSSITDLRKSLHAEFYGEQDQSSVSVSVDKTFLGRAYTRVGFLLHNLTHPVRLIFAYTIPNVHDEKYRPYYPLTMLMSIAWLGLLAQGLLSCIDIVGELFQLHPVFLGLTIGAWGASTPTLMSSMVVSKQGLGDMALSNALGANVFSVLVGLGLPWFAYPLYISGTYDGMQDAGILPLLLVLIANIIIYYIVIAYNSYVVKFWMGYVFMAMYIVTISLCATIFKST
jgi:Ca2+/Na+ antiporter